MLSDKEDMNSQEKEIHLIYLRPSSMFISKKRYSHWREIQDEYDTYMTSLGPWNQNGLIDFPGSDWGNDESGRPFTRAQIERFMNSDEQILKS